MLFCKLLEWLEVPQVRDNGRSAYEATYDPTMLPKKLDRTSNASWAKKCYQSYSRKDRTVRRKSPEKTFTETDRYTLHLQDGTRNQAVEHYLGDIENDFQGVLRVLRQRQPLTVGHRAKLCTFTAAMLGRSTRQGDWILKQQLERLEMMREMERSHDAEPVTSHGMEKALQNHHGELVVNTIEVAAPILSQMKLTILSTDDTLGFITSDAPAVMYNPKSHTFPPLYRSPGFMQADVEVTLPLTPQHLILFSHKLLYRQYLPLSLSAVDEINRTTLFNCDKEIVSRTGAIKDCWFSERDEPTDAWRPHS